MSVLSTGRDQAFLEGGAMLFRQVCDRAEGICSRSAWAEPACEDVELWYAVAGETEDSKALWGA